MGEDDGREAPADPMTAMAEGAAGLHELYISFLAAGFTADQALYLCGQVMRGQSGPTGA